MARDDLTVKQRRFVQLYLKHGNATEAYKAAYNVKKMTDDAIRVESCRLLRHPNIAHYLSGVNKKAEEMAVLTLEEHMAELQLLREMAKDKGQLNSAITAEVKRGELRRFYVKQIEQGSAGEFDGMSDDELIAFIEGDAAGEGQGEENPPGPSRSERTIKRSGRIH